MFEGLGAVIVLRSHVEVRGGGEAMSCCPHGVGWGGGGSKFATMSKRTATYY